MFVLPLIFAAGTSAEENLGKSQDPLTIKNVQNWTANGNVVPVCWETPGYNREKAIVREALSRTWEYYANIRFTGWHACPSGIGIGGSASDRHVRVRITPQDASNAGAYGAARYGMDALSSAAENNPGVSLTFNPDGTADKGRVEYIGVHEFGHVLGFVHEQDTPGNVEGPAYCKSPGNEPDATSLTAYDRDSVMNYCNSDGNMKGNLTDFDISGAHAVYGFRRGRIRIPVATEVSSNTIKASRERFLGESAVRTEASSDTIQASRKPFPVESAVTTEASSATSESLRGTTTILPPLKPDPPICASARKARARNSPATPGLEAQCRAAGGTP